MDVRYVFVFYAAIFVGFTECQLDDFGSAFSSPDSKKTYCGRHLAQTLSAVCRGNYNKLVIKKRDNYDYDVSYPYKSKASATSLISNFRSRKRRGVYNECCEKPCSYEELSSYCGGRRKR